MSEIDQLKRRLAASKGPQLTKYYHDKYGTSMEATASLDTDAAVASTIAPSALSLNDENYPIRKELALLRNQYSELQDRFARLIVEYDTEKDYSDKISDLNVQLNARNSQFQEEAVKKDAKLSHQEVKINKMRAKYEKSVSENEALRLQLIHMPNRGSLDDSRASPDSVNSSIKKYLSLIDTLSSEKQNLERDNFLGQEEIKNLNKRIEQFSQQIELARLEKEDLITQNKSQSDVLADIHRRYQDSVLQLESERELNENLRSQLNSSIQAECGGLTGVNWVMQTASQFADYNQIIHQLRFELQEKSIQYDSIAKRFSAATLSHGSVSSNDIAESARFQEYQNQIDEISAQLAEATSQLIVERKDHEDAKAKYILHLTEFENLLNATRDEFKNKLAVIQGGRDAAVAKCAELSEIIHGYSLQEQHEDILTNKKIMEQDQEISSLKKELQCRGERYVAVVASVQHVVKELIENAKYINEDVVLMKESMMNLSDTVSLFAASSHHLRMLPLEGISHDSNMNGIGFHANESENRMLHLPWTAYCNELSTSFTLLINKVMRVNHLETRFKQELNDLYQRYALEKSRADELAILLETSQRQMRDYSLKISIQADESTTWRQQLSQCEQERGRERADTSAKLISAEELISTLARQVQSLQGDIARLNAEISFYKSSSSRNSSELIDSAPSALVASHEENSILLDKYQALQGEMDRMTTKANQASTDALRQIRELNERNKLLQIQIYNQTVLTNNQFEAIRKLKQQFVEIYKLLQAVQENRQQLLGILAISNKRDEVQQHDQESLNRTFLVSQLSFDPDTEISTGIQSNSLKSQPPSSTKKRLPPSTPEQTHVTSIPDEIKSETIVRPVPISPRIDNDKKKSDTFDVIPMQSSVPPIPRFNTIANSNLSAKPSYMPVGSRARLARSPTLTNASSLLPLTSDDENDAPREQDLVDVSSQELVVTRHSSDSVLEMNSSTSLYARSQHGTPQVHPESTATPPASNEVVDPVNNAVPPLQISKLPPVTTVRLFQDEQTFQADVEKALTCSSGRDSDGMESLPSSREPDAVKIEANSNIAVETVTSFAEQYEFGEEIGRGTFGVVYKSRRLVTNQFVAIKMVQRSNLSQSDEDCIRKENAILGLLNEKDHHPNIIEFFDFYEDSSAFFIVLELVVGGELFDRLVKKIFYSEKESRDIVYVILSAIQHCHNHNVVHRDLKPENLLLVSVNEDDRIKLIDFGVSEIAEDETLDGFVGSLGYIAPELMSFKNHGKPVDMWAIGVISYLLLCGFLPFDISDNIQHRKAVRKGTFTFPDQYFSQVSSEAKDLIKGLLTVDTKKRLTINQALAHPWFSVSGKQLTCHPLPRSFTQLRIFNARRKFKILIRVILAKAKFERRLMVAKPLFWNSVVAGGSGEAGNISRPSFADQYEIISEIRKGDMGSEFRGIDKISQKIVAIQIIDRKNITRRGEEILKSAFTLNQMVNTHPNILCYYDFYEDESSFFIVSELTTDSDIVDNVASRVTYTERDARSAIIILLSVVRYLHSKSIAHRNITPENVVIVSTAGGPTMKVNDFKQAVLMNTISFPQDICGTIGYMAPEILQDSTHSLAVDMWSIGTIAYLLLQGQLPFGNMVSNYLSQARDSPTSLVFSTENWNTISNEAIDFVCQLLHADPTKRLTADQALEHPWMCLPKEVLKDCCLYKSNTTLRMFNARRRFRSLAKAIVARSRFLKMAHNAVCLTNIDAAGDEKKLTRASTMEIVTPAKPDINALRKMMRVASM